jgi:hypothetical protein
MVGAKPARAIARLTSMGLTLNPLTHFLAPFVGVDLHNFDFNLIGVELRCHILE